jgi:hypothetical protein
MGFADIAGDRVTHYFTDPEIYSLAFTTRPEDAHWKKLAELVEFDRGRADTLETKQAGASQYLLAFASWQFAKSYVPAAQRFRQSALEEGVRAGEIEKRSGSITSPQSIQEAYLASNTTYQVWRLMTNMKELLVESVAHILSQKYGPLNTARSMLVLEHFDLHGFIESGDLRALAQAASNAIDLATDQVFGRIFGFLRHVATQFWEEKQKQLLSTSRLRTALLSRQVAADFKRQIAQTNARKALDKAWKPEGVTFLESLPALQ